MRLTDTADLQNILVRYVLPPIGCIVAAITTIYIMSEINPLAAALLCASVIFFVMAVVSPRMGFFILFGLCAYTDLSKRLLIFWSDLSYEQISYVLAGAPLVVAGLVLALVTRWAFHTLDVNRRDFALAMFALGVMGINFLLGWRETKQWLEGAKAAVNIGLYVSLMPLSAKFFSGEEDMLKVLRVVSWIFVPVAIYGIKQSIFGFADFEMRYQATGLTVTAFEEVPRPFGTLNSAGALGDMSAVLAVLALAPFLVIPREKSSLTLRICSGLVLPLFMGSCVIALVRHSYFVFLASVFGYFCFRSAWRTRVFYITGGVLAVVLVLSSSYLLDHLAAWDPANNASSEFAERALSIQTYAERLKGFSNLTSSWDMYSAFGLPEERKKTETTYNHDPISGILVDHGVFGLAFVLIGAIAVIRYAHVQVLKLPEGSTRNFGVMLLSMMIALTLSHALFAGVLTTFPVNVFFWLFAGMLDSLILRSREHPAASEAGTELEEAITPAWQPAIEQPGARSRW